VACDHKHAKPADKSERSAAAASPKYHDLDDGAGITLTLTTAKINGQVAFMSGTQSCGRTATWVALRMPNLLLGLMN